MKLQPVTVYRIYITTSDNDLIENIVTRLKKNYNIDKIILKKSKNVRDFIYIEIEASKIGSREEVEKFFREEGVEQVKIDIVELKRPM